MADVAIDYESSDWDFIKELDSLAGVQLDSIALVNKNKELYSTALDTLSPQLDTLITKIKTDAIKPGFEYKEKIASTAQGDAAAIGEDLISFLENTNVDELFTEAALIEGRTMEAVDLGWLERGVVSPPVPGHYPMNVDPESLSEKIGSADKFGGYLGLTGDVTKDYGYTMGTVADASIWKTGIDPGIVAGWPDLPQRAFLLSESDPALYENYMTYALEQNDEGIYVHDQNMVDSALAYKTYLDAYDTLQDIVRDQFTLPYDVPHFILPNQPGTRTELQHTKWGPATGEEGQALWDVEGFQDPEFRAEYGSKTGFLGQEKFGDIPFMLKSATAHTGIGFEWYDIIEKLEAAPDQSPVKQAYNAYVASVNDAQSFVTNAQQLNREDKARYMYIRNILNFQQKGIVDPKGVFGLGPVYSYLDEEPGGTGGFQSLEQFRYADKYYQSTLLDDTSKDWGAGSQEAQDLKYIQKKNQDLISILAGLKELEY